jgi:Holliday junction resolvase RusA-like endonuclease
MILLPHKFITLNTYIEAERINKYKAAQLKKHHTYIAYLFFRARKDFFQSASFPVKLNFVWLLKNKRNDLDNVVFARKFILDGMVAAKLIKNDGQYFINGFSDAIEYSKAEGVRMFYTNNGG